MNCPWSSWRPSDLHFCEAAVCGWVKQPANAYSNVAFLIVAALIWTWWHRTNRQMAKELVQILVILFVGSFFLHASMTFIGEVADFLGMFFYVARLLLWNAERFNRRPVRHAEAWYWFLTTIPVVLMFFGFRGVPLFETGIALVLGFEALIYLTGDRKASYRYLAAIGGIMAVAYKIWWLDVDELWCQPHNHVMSGHVIWHCLTAFTFLLTAKFYEGYRKDRRNLT